jgi:phosphoribosylformylglycinamidine synthase
MTFTALINIMPLKELLDPQGEAVHNSLRNLGLGNIQDVRIGKHITLQIEAENKAAAEKVAEEACRKLLANPVMEYFEVVSCE